MNSAFGIYVTESNHWFVLTLIDVKNSWLWPLEDVLIWNRRGLVVSRAKNGRAWILYSEDLLVGSKRLDHETGFNIVNRSHETAGDMVV